MDQTTQLLVKQFEQAFAAPKDALHMLANKHTALPSGVIDYWLEKLQQIQNDVEMLKAISDKINMADTE